MVFTKEISDCSFSVGTPPKIYYANKVVLAAYSPVFFKMLYGELKENCENPINLIDIDSTAFELFLEFCYTREIGDLECTCDEEESFNSLCYNCSKKPPLFSKNFAKMCYLAEKYITAEFKDYCLSSISKNFVSLPQELFVPIYSGACLIRAENLKKQCEEHIKTNPITYLYNSDINELQIDDFVNLILILFEHHYAAKQSPTNFYSALFAAIEAYAKCNCIATDGKIGTTREKLEKLFLKMLHDDRINKVELISGPAKSTFLKDDEAAKVLQKFHS